MASPVLGEMIDRLLAIGEDPYMKTDLLIAKVVKMFIQADFVQDSIQAVGDTELMSALDVINEMEEQDSDDEMDEADRERLARRAASATVEHLRSAYKNYLIYYEKRYEKAMPKQWEVHVPYLWIFNEIHIAVARRGIASIQDTMAGICFLMAFYMKQLGEKRSVVKKWLCEQKFPCNNYKILAGLLGPEAAMEYIASNPDIGNIIAGAYLSEEHVSLTDYYADKPVSDTGSDGISFGEEDPIIYLD